MKRRREQARQLSLLEAGPDSPRTGRRILSWALVALLLLVTALGSVVATHRGWFEALWGPLVTDIELEESRSEARLVGFEQGYESGYADGWQEGFGTEYDRLRPQFVRRGFEAGYREGLRGGLRRGERKGYSAGRADGYDQGFDQGFDEGYAFAQSCLPDFCGI
jgi:hypothetical protein